MHDLTGQQFCPDSKHSVGPHLLVPGLGGLVIHKHFLAFLGSNLCDS